MFFIIYGKDRNYELLILVYCKESSIRSLNSLFYIYYFGNLFIRLFFEDIFVICL